MKTLREEVLAQLILARLNEDKRTCGQTIDVIVDGSDTYLVGWCDKEEQRTMALTLAQGMTGVRIVIDQIKVRKIAQSI